MYFDNPDPRSPDTMRSMRRSIIFHLKSWRVFVPIGEVSLRSALLAAAPGDEDTQAAADSLLEGMGEIEETLSRFTGTPPEQVVYCGVSSSMVSGCWGLFEFRLGARGYLYYQPDFGVGDDESLPIFGAWEPADNPAARRACILRVYSREWRNRALPPAMGEWATGEPGLLQEAILRVQTRRRGRRCSRGSSRRLNLVKQQSRQSKRSPS
jgi:hypothetical protein